MTRWLALAGAAGLMVVATGAAGQQTQTYTYDVHGRLEASTQAPANGGSRTLYSLDKADNRDGSIAGVYGARAANDRLGSAEWMLPSQRITSPDNRFYLILQPGDGNLVFYGPGGALWASNTATGRSTALAMQADGNLVLRGSTNETLWSTGTNGNTGAVLIVQNDGNLVVKSGATVLWASVTGGH